MCSWYIFFLEELLAWNEYKEVYFLLLHICLKMNACSILTHVPPLLYRQCCSFSRKWRQHWNFCEKYTFPFSVSPDNSILFSTVALSLVVSLKNGAQEIFKRATGKYMMGFYHFLCRDKFLWIFSPSANVTFFGEKICF